MRALAVGKRARSTLASTLAPLVEQYNRDGYAIVRNAIPKDLVSEMQQHVEYLQKKYPTVPTEHLHHLILQNDAFWMRLCNERRLLDIAQAFAPFLANGVALFSSHYFVKKPRTGMAVLWHQDGSYWPLRPMDVLTLWVAADASTKANGCLRVVKGSHKSELAELKPDRSVLNVLGSSTHSASEIDPSLIVDLELEPGDLSIHHPNIIHGSEPNTSDTRRCGLTIRYISTSTECLDKGHPLMMMRGEPVKGINTYRSWPKYRVGYDMPFKGCEEWNGRRFVNPDDEAHFNRTDFKNIDEEIQAGLDALIDSLGGKPKAT
jgi:phytanoyl-CoA hydroxylase